MTDEEKGGGGGLIVEFSDGMTRIRLSKEDYDAFIRWQQLDRHQKDTIIYVGIKGGTVRRLIKISDWLAGLGYLILRAGAIAAAVIAVVSVWRNFFGDTM